MSNTDPLNHLLESKILEPKTKNSNLNILDLRNSRTVAQTELIAEKLVKLFNAPDYQRMFLKAAWRLSDGKIAYIVEKALEAPYPVRYFAHAVKNEKAYNAKT